MPATYRYTNEATVRQVASDLLPAMTLDDPIFKIFPIKPHKRTKLRWRIKDNPRGLMQLRGLGGEPREVELRGERWYEAAPGIFGEFIPLNEEELMNRAGEMDPGENRTVTVNDLIAEAQEELMSRYVNRLRQMGWKLALDGTMSISLPGGGIGYLAEYDITTVTPAIPFTTLATAIPLRELQKLDETYGRGTSTAWDNRATAYANSKTINLFLNNINAADLGGKRVANNISIRSIEDINKIMMDFNIPRLEKWNGGYENENGAFQIAIPDNRLLIVGARADNSVPGETQLTKNVNNPGDAPGVYAFVEDLSRGPRKTVPPKIIVHQGFNGGQVVERPTQMIKMVVGV